MWCAPLCAVAATGGSSAALYPDSCAAQIDELLAVAADLEAAAAAWVEPTCQAASPADREAAQHRIAAQLQALADRLQGTQFLVSFFRRFACRCAEQRPPVAAASRRPAAAAATAAALTPPPKSACCRREAR